ncbi:MAG: primosomal protein N' (replication factor Y) [Myxococcota bacterium]
MLVSFVRIAVSLPVDGLYTYKVPEGLELEIGHTVSVPFGRQKVSGYVVELLDESDYPKAKKVDRLIDVMPAFDHNQLTFFKWISRYYLAGLGEVIATALPVAYRQKARRVHIATEEGVEALAGDAVEAGPRSTVLREIVSRPGRTRRGLTRMLHNELTTDEVGSAIDALIRAGLICLEEREFGGPASQITTISLVMDRDKIPSLRGKRQKGVLAMLLAADGDIDLPTILEKEGPNARSAVVRLEEMGILKRGTREDRRAAAPQEMPGRKQAFAPNAEQAAALHAIRAATQETFLLHGVTGSGKTEVYLQAAASIIQAGKQVLILVPEIALTPLLTGRVRARFGDRVAVLHSGMTSTERLREWRRIRAGECTIAVGARSALFAPFQRLGLIVVDEEHDDSYKQDEGVRYHARDLAVLRGRLGPCPVILGSATPSLESWHNAASGRYVMLRMRKRATPRPVPDIELIDTRGRPARQAIAPEVRAAIAEVISAGSKAIVLYNRRGYAPVVECPGCGAHYDCPSCGVNLVYHRNRNRLNCHYCGFHRDFVRDCPACGTGFEVIGHGTERVEEELKEQFPGVGILRMDADTTSSRGSHFKILEAFRTGAAQLLVGTQLVAKGHDFPNVQLAAVVGIDHILMLPDFRSAERTYALATQLAGRAGRGEIAGRVLVQTRHPDHFVFRLLSGEFNKKVADPAMVFYAQEVRQRRILRYPPFSRLVLVRIEGADREQTQERAGKLARDLRVAAENARVDLLGPVLAPLSRLVGRWRYQLILRGHDVAALRTWLDENRSTLRSAGRGRVRVTLDVDPRSLL